METPRRIVRTDLTAIYSAACHAQSHDGQIYIGVGRFNGQPVKVLIDTGSVDVQR